MVQVGGVVSSTTGKPGCSHSLIGRQPGEACSPGCNHGPNRRSLPAIPRPRARGAAKAVKPMTLTPCPRLAGRRDRGRPAWRPSGASPRGRARRRSVAGAQPLIRGLAGERSLQVDARWTVSCSPAHEVECDLGRCVFASHILNARGAGRVQCTASWRQAEPGRPRRSSTFIRKSSLASWAANPRINAETLPSRVRDQRAACRGGSVVRRRGW
jgi:hypothetical protein